ncbi:hypothetical protein Phi47:1_gp78 [Cellulophaga phage phi47:1]|nr:hypothetical protein Phi3ST:2_gp78 [Cellulophaga phage phi3ST:2]AGO48274.1 hypothetical protein PhiSM_gp79 [Cellulophaga phage phiSM]AGO49317.1 hypothetical protein Phi38:2_gp78 [Cellulophaga phage phi38:2]AGO49398.1 hypothetical protein Phi3:1_gp79 [Cellulophaga phage phi3:1]AGO49815.1 hypothetical protein Phi47:1_gp78 [Cellulophaga phage phi47:1]
MSTLIQIKHEDIFSYNKEQRQLTYERLRDTFLKQVIEHGGYRGYDHMLVDLLEVPCKGEDDSKFILSYNSNRIGTLKVKRKGNALNLSLIYKD